MVEANKLNSVEGQTKPGLGWWVRCTELKRLTAAATVQKPACLHAVCPGISRPLSPRLPTSHSRRLGSPATLTIHHRRYLYYDMIRRKSFKTAPAPDVVYPPYTVRNNFTKSITLSIRYMSTISYLRYQREKRKKKKKVKEAL